jgi:CheY-like chemotaxis protein
MQLLIGGWGCEVQSADSLAAVAGLDIRQGAPDLIIADYHLGDGTGVAAILASREQFAPLHSGLMITADRTLEVRAEAERHGIGIQHKPVRPAALRAYITQISAQKRARLRSSRRSAIASRPRDRARARMDGASPNRMRYMIGATTRSMTASIAGKCSPRPCARSAISLDLVRVKPQHLQALAPVLRGQHVADHVAADARRHLLGILLGPGLEIAPAAAGIDRHHVGAQALDGDVGQKLLQIAPAAIDGGRRHARLGGDQRDRHVGAIHARQQRADCLVHRCLHPGASTARAEILFCCHCQNRPSSSRRAMVQNL